MVVPVVVFSLALLVTLVIILLRRRHRDRRQACAEESLTDATVTTPASVMIEFPATAGPVSSAAGPAGGSSPSLPGPVTVHKRAATSDSELPAAVVDAELGPDDNAGPGLAPQDSSRAASRVYYQ